MNADRLGALAALPEDERRTLSRCLNLLLGHTFILRRSDRDEYYFIRRYQEAIQSYLDLADWDLLHDDLNQVFQAVNRHDTNRRNLTRLESELLLVLCVSYLEQQAELRLTETPLITMADLRLKYLSLLGDSGRLTQTGLREALQTLRRYRLIDAVGGRRFNPQNPDQGIQLLPTLRLALDVEQIQQVQERLAAYARQPDGGEPEAEEEA